MRNLAPAQSFSRILYNIRLFFSILLSEEVYLHNWKVQVASKLYQVWFSSFIVDNSRWCNEIRRTCLLLPELLTFNRLHTQQNKFFIVIWDGWWSLAVVTLKYFLFILQNLNWQEDKVEINTMQDVTGKVSLGTHFLSLDIYYSPHCHELWSWKGNVCCQPAKCPSLTEPHEGLALNQRHQGTFSYSLEPTQLPVVNHNKKK